ncbi:MAG: hypothetical protein ACREDF_04275 [Thermoplasmata archaeon]
MRIDRSIGSVVLGWKSSEGGLFLRVRGQAEEVRVVCVCGRSHWIVRENFSGDGPSLVLTCHHCGYRATFLMEGVSLPAP